MSEREEFRLDPNTADEEGLCQLPGVGPAMAERIMAARPFEGADDLMRVRGVGPTVLARMRPFLLPSFAEGEGEQQESEAEQTEGDAVADWPATEAEVVEVKAPEPLAIEGVFAAPVDGEGEAQEVFSLSAEELPAVAESLSAADRILPAAAEEPPVPPPEFGAVAAEALSEIAAEGKEEAPEPSPVMHEQGPALPGTGPAPQLAPQRPGLTRAYVGWMVGVGGLLTLILALAVSLGVLAALNGGQLQFVRPGEFGQLQVQVEGLETRAGVLDRDVASLRTRLNSMEALSGRVGDLEQVAEQLQRDLDGVESSIESLTGQVSDLQGEMVDLTGRLEKVGSEIAGLTAQLDEVNGEVETLQAQSERSQAFLDGLRDLVNGLFEPEGGPQ